MKHVLKTIGQAALFTSLLTLATQAGAETAAKAQSQAAQSQETQRSIYKGFFDDEQVKARALSDWEGDWQSVYPYLTNGTLDPVMAEKAKTGDKSAQEYRDYYETGYKTDVDRIVIDGKHITFYRGKQSVAGDYKTDGHEILTYRKGNRGVRFIFKKVSGDAGAPNFIQFSDHMIAPEKAFHYHLYAGNDRAELLKEVTNWPTYYPARLSGKEIVEEMLAH